MRVASVRYSALQWAPAQANDQTKERSAIMFKSQNNNWWWRSSISVGRS